ncbi:MAG: hypothetical protein M1825_004825 [Sarcosagium campestre]|nr:MAG: hypothetical protein M1825_004825 [Sarcosagium campestre]
MATRAESESPVRETESPAVEHSVRMDRARFGYFVSPTRSPSFMRAQQLKRSPVNVEQARSPSPRSVQSMREPIPLMLPESHPSSTFERFRQLRRIKSMPLGPVPSTAKQRESEHHLVPSPPGSAPYAVRTFADSKSSDDFEFGFPIKQPLTPSLDRSPIFLESSFEHDNHDNHDNQLLLKKLGPENLGTEQPIASMFNKELLGHPMSRSCSLNHRPRRSDADSILASSSSTPTFASSVFTSANSSLTSAKSSNYSSTILQDDCSSCTSDIETESSWLRGDWVETSWLQDDSDDCLGGDEASSSTCSFPDLVAPKSEHKSSDSTAMRVENSSDPELVKEPRSPVKSPNGSPELESATALTPRRAAVIDVTSLQSLSPVRTRIMNPNVVSGPTTPTDDTAPMQSAAENTVTPPRSPNRSRKAAAPRQLAMSFSSNRRPKLNLSRPSTPPATPEDQRLHQQEQQQQQPSPTRSSGRHRSSSTLSSSPSPTVTASALDTLPTPAPPSSFGEDFASPSSLARLREIFPGARHDQLCALHEYVDTINAMKTLLASRDPAPPHKAVACNEIGLSSQYELSHSVYRLRSIQLELEGYALKVIRDIMLDNSTSQALLRALLIIVGSKEKLDSSG